MPLESSSTRRIIPDSEFPEVEIPKYDDDDEYEEQSKVYEKRIQKARMRREEEKRKKAEKEELYRRAVQKKIEASKERVGEEVARRRPDEKTMKTARGKQLDRAGSAHAKYVFDLNPDQLNPDQRQRLSDFLETMNAPPRALNSDPQIKKQGKTDLDQILGITLPENEKCLSCYHGGIGGRDGWPCKVEENHVKPQSCNTCSRRHKRCVWEGFEECAPSLKRKNKMNQGGSGKTMWPSKKQKTLEEFWGKGRGNGDQEEVEELIDDNDEEEIPLDVLVDIRDRVGMIVEQNELMLDLSHRQTQYLEIISNCSKISAFQSN